MKMLKFILLAVAVLAFADTAIAQGPASPQQTPLREQILKTANDLRNNTVGIADSVAGSAIKHSERLGKTQIGKSIMFMIAWKILATDVVQLIVGVLLLAFALPLFVQAFKRDCLLSSTETKMPDGSVKIDYKEPDGNTQGGYYAAFIFGIIIISFIALA